MLRRYLTMIALFGLLTACGGGGGGGSNPGPVVSTLTFQFKTAWGAYQQQTKIFPVTLSGTASGQLGSFPISGSGTVTQTSTTAPQLAMDGSGTTVQAIKVTRVYAFTALVNGYSIPQRLTDVAYYDPTTYAYMSDTFTDNSGTSSPSNTVMAGWTVPPDTLQCCNSGTPFYQTAIAPGGPVVQNISLSVAADTANSVFVNLTDSTPPGASRSYRLDNTNTLAPVTEKINAVAYVLMSNGYTYPFNAAVTFNY